MATRSVPQRPKFELFDSGKDFDNWFQIDTQPEYTRLQLHIEVSPVSTAADDHETVSAFLAALANVRGAQTAIAA